MNDPRYPFHAISDYDADGNIPFVSRLPREEEDFATVSAARDWLAERGGGVVEQCVPAQRWQRIDRVAPAAAGETALRC